MRAGPWALSRRGRGSPPVVLLSSLAGAFYPPPVPWPPAWMPPPGPPPIPRRTVLLSIVAAALFMGGFVGTLVLPTVIVILGGEGHLGILAVLFPPGTTDPYLYLTAYEFCAAGLALFLLAYVAQWRVFREFWKAGEKKFRLPGVMVLVAIAGCLLLLVGVLGIASSAGPLNTCLFANGWKTSSETVPAACTGQDSPVISFETVWFLGFLLVFLGWLGVGAGFYRLGTRMEEWEVKLGGVLFVVPGFSLFAPLLLLEGYVGILRTPPAPSPPPAPPYVGWGAPPPRGFPPQGLPPYPPSPPPAGPPVP